MSRRQSFLARQLLILDHRKPFVETGKANEFELVGSDHAGISFSIIGYLHLDQPSQQRLTRKTFVREWEFRGYLRGDIGDKVEEVVGVLAKLMLKLFQSQDGPGIFLKLTGAALPHLFFVGFLEHIIEDLRNAATQQG